MQYWIQAEIEREDPEGEYETLSAHGERLGPYDTIEQALDVMTDIVNTPEPNNPDDTSLKAFGEPDRPLWGITIWIVRRENPRVSKRRYFYATREQALRARHSDEIGENGRVW